MMMRLRPTHWPHPHPPCPNAAAGTDRRPRTLRSLALPAGAIALFLAGCVSQPPAAHPSLVAAIDHYTGAAGAVNDARARELLEEAVAEGGPIAIMWLARVHSTGRMSYPQDEARARELAGSVINRIERAAESGVPEAVFLMGTAYDEGLGREIDHEQAAIWHRRAAEAGHVLGAHVLGNQYSEGRGVPEDPVEAVVWWLQAAEAGDAITQLRLGEAYEVGRGVAQDPVQARQWYERAARAGNAAAAEALARMDSEAQ